MIVILFVKKGERNFLPRVSLTNYAFNHHTPGTIQYRRRRLWKSLHHLFFVLDKMNLNVILIKQSRLRPDVDEIIIRSSSVKA